MQQGAHVLVLRQIGHRRASREAPGSNNEHRPDDTGHSESERSSEKVLHVRVLLGGSESAKPIIRRLGSHEVLYCNRLYDLVRQKQQGDTLHVWLLRDREEERALIGAAGHDDRSGPLVQPPPDIRPTWILPVGPTPSLRETDLPKTNAVVLDPAIPTPFDVPVPPPRA